MQELAERGLHAEKAREGARGKAVQASSTAKSLQRQVDLLQAKLEGLEKRLKYVAAPI